MTSQGQQGHLAQNLTSNTILKKGNQGLLEKWLILGPEQDIHRVILGHLFVPESKELLQSHKLVGVSEQNAVQWERPSGQSWNSFNNKVNDEIIK